MGIECYEGACKWHEKEEPFCTQEECLMSEGLNEKAFLPVVEVPVRRVPAMKPVGDRVLVRMAIAPKMTKGEHGSPIFVPDRARTLAQEGVVLAVGSGYRDPEGFLHPIEDVAAGDRVLFEKRKGQHLQVRGEERWLVRYEDVLAVVEVRGEE